MNTQADRFNNAFTRYYRPVRGYLTRRVGETAGEDLAAETFTIAWAKITDVSGDLDLAWLLAIARRVAANHLRRQRRRDAATQRLETMTRTWVEPPGLTLDDSLLGVLARLEVKDKEILTLVAWEELSMAEVAIVLDCSRANAALRLHRARRRARKLLDETAARALLKTEGNR